MLILAEQAAGLPVAAELQTQTYSRRRTQASFSLLRVVYRSTLNATAVSSWIMIPKLLVRMEHPHLAALSAAMRLVISCLSWILWRFQMSYLL